MEHIESPNLSELEATLDFLKKTPEKKDDEETGTVLNPMPAIEPPKLDAEKRMPGSDEADDVTPSPAAQDIAFEDENAADHSNESNNGASVSDKNETVVSEEIIKKAEALKEKQLLNDTVNNEAELALKKDEANITKTSDDVNNEPPKEISDAVKEAMALQAEYEAKKKDMPEEDLRRRSRFMRKRAYPVKNAAGAAAEQGETGADKKESNQNDALFEEIDSNPTSQGYETYIFKWDNIDEYDVYIDLNNLTVNEDGFDQQYKYFKGTFQTLDEAKVFIDTLKINEEGIK